jgi:hypothetical protein
VILQTGGGAVNMLFRYLTQPMNQISSFHKGISSSIVAFVMSETMVVFDN